MPSHAVGRASDIIVRYGGEECLIVLPDTHSDGARALAERLQQRIAATAIVTDTIQLDITASVGIATLDSRDRHVDTLIERDDQSLYAARQAGRSRVSVTSRAEATADYASAIDPTA